ncbi:MAG TPA: hypothetical protein PKD24_05810 [Pyrinomonadaceae bacterium]|nr:hypothetical protein [Pyrinomonadaceae bacterium]HMP65330.1 hypothetical protein [Pyrinomonadaceae bacterium]
MKLKWRFGVVAGIFLAIFCLYPQLKMWYVRGDAWNGHYAYNDIDEVAYASYLRALIDGRPRKNDPYTGRDHTPENPQPESLFSIQFAAPYTLAIPSRLLGVGTPWAMILAGAMAGFLSALFVFWLIGRLTGDPWFAMAAALGVFCFGTLAAGEGAALEIFLDGFSYPYFPGFRRYIPALAFPAFFAFCALVWRLMTDSEMRRSRELIYSVAAVICFSYTVYSYFYVWTTAAAFLGCLFLVWLAERPEGWRNDLKRLTLVVGGCLFALIPYAWLLTHRAETMDHVQLLVHTRQPDLFRFPEYLAFAVLIALIIGLAAKAIELRDRSVLFAIALALVPFVIFNQQVVTGRSLQPIHYQVFIGNYVASLAVFFTVGLFWRRLGQVRMLPKLISAGLTVVAIGWGIVECHYTVRVLDWANERRDLGLPVAKRLEQLAETDPDPHRTTVLSFDGIFADDMPSVAPQNILWARHQHVFAGLNWEESKERYYQYLYYSNVDGPTLDRLLRRDFVSQIALFGWGRHTDRLSAAATPLTEGEVTQEVATYEEYIENFGRRQALAPLISFVVVANEGKVDMTNLERWYELDRGEVIGAFTLYRATPREVEETSGQ